jgi:hypothetical protein
MANCVCLLCDKQSRISSESIGTHTHGLLLIMSFRAKGFVEKNKKSWKRHKCNRYYVLKGDTRACLLKAHRYQ